MGQEVVTKRDLAERGIDALDQGPMNSVTVSATAGGVSFSSALEVMNFAKLMAVSQQAVPPAFRNNPGMCLAIAFQAIEWRMSPFAVVNKAYVVNDRIGFESQLLHAVVEARAPLQKRLRCSYSGEGPTRACTVTGLFRGETEPHEYTSPMVKDIKTKNSPLWQSDIDQQLFFFASRSWARKWAPDVLLGIYTKEELADIQPDPGQAEQNGLHARLSGAQRTDEGHRDGHASKTIAEISTTASGELQKEAAKPEPDGTAKVAIGRRRKRGRAASAVEQEDESAPTREEKEASAKAKTEQIAAQEAKDNPPKGSPADVANRAEAMPTRQADPGPQPAVLTDPKTVAEYIAYAERWIDAIDSFDDAAARWDGEMEMRDNLVVPIAARNTLGQRIRNRFPEVD